MKMTLEDIEVAGKRVLVRVDFNVPLEQGIERLPEYDHRIRSSIPTIQYLIDHNARVILCSHLGRPGGKVVEGLRMAPVAARLEALLGRPVKTAPDCVGPTAEKAVDSLRAGEVLLLENLRFYPGETSNDPDFAHALASLADLFVMDAFAVAHRPHASTVGVPQHLPSAAGFLLKREMEMMGQILGHPERPLGVLLGGAKVSDKIKLLENLLPRISTLLIGGGMAATFLKAQRLPVGQSRVEDDLLEVASRLRHLAIGKGITYHKPLDVVVASEFSEKAQPMGVFPAENVPENGYIMDIGPKTVEVYIRNLLRCRTILWNGPMGVFEFPAFADGTNKLAHAIANMKATTIVGGGSTVEVVEALGLSDHFTHVSTGGGASLEFLEGGELPGIAALPDKERPGY
jgi:phosphoglycerate kinase